MIITEGDTSLNETCFIRRWDEVVAAEVAKKPMYISFQIFAEELSFLLAQAGFLALRGEVGFIGGNVADILP